MSSEKFEYSRYQFETGKRCLLRPLSKRDNRAFVLCANFGDLGFFWIEKHSTLFYLENAEN